MLNGVGNGGMYVAGETEDGSGEELKGRARKMEMGKCGKWRVIL